MADNAEKEVVELISKELSRIDESVKDTHSKLKEVVERQEQEIKELGGTSTSTRKTLSKLEARYDQEVADIKGLIDSLGDNYKELQSAIAKAQSEAAEKQWKEAGPERKNLEKVIEEADGWKDWNPEGNRTSPIVKIGSIADYEVGGRKDITGGDALDSVFGRTLWTNTIYGVPFNDNMRLRDYMRVERVEGFSVHYVERTSFDNDAAFQTAPGAPKEESDWNFQEREAKADVLAHWTRITKQQARQTPTVVRFIQNELLEGLYHAETRQILFADGTAPGEFTGIFNHPRVQTYSEAVAGETAIDSLRRSENQLGDFYLMGDLYVVNHRDWTEIELLKDGEERYIWVSVQEGGTARMWRKPVIATRAMPRGHFINGCFRTCATLLDFERAQVQMYPQHSDFATRNMVAMLAEETIGLAITTPEGFVVGNFPGYGSGS